MIIWVIKPQHPTLPESEAGLLSIWILNAKGDKLHSSYWIVCPIKLIRISLPHNV